MKKMRFILRKNDGFTLIEIIAVLIILGILAAVAVPRYLDMTKDAHGASVEGALSAGIANYNLAFSNFLAINKVIPTQLNGFVLQGGTTDVTIEHNLGDFEVDTFTYLAGPPSTITVKIKSADNDGDGDDVVWFANWLLNNAGDDEKVIPAGW